MTIRDEQHCFFDPDYRYFVKICFHISATCFFVLPVFILCILYALMGRRLYSTSILNQLYWSKPSTTDTYGSPSICVEKAPRTKRHSSNVSVLTRYSFIRRSTKTSLSALSVQIQSMKKSAFKMLCKYVGLEFLRTTVP